MAFATDRDLLVLEPAVFERVAWVGQRRAAGTGDVSGSVLTAAQSDAGFDAAGIGAGSVVLIGGVAHEVLSVDGPSAMAVSKLRDGVDGPAVPAGDAPGVGFAVWTFAPQIADVHRRVLGMLGLGEPGGPGADDVINPADLRGLEAIGALHLVYAGASAAGGSGSVEAERAAWYRGRFAEERSRVAARIDLDGDGVADVIRRPGVVALRRG